ncbi:hypothetical protein V6N13_136927 [Hibiscus sabdariffa]
MDSKPKRKGDTGEDLFVATMIGNGDDLGPLVQGSVKQVEIEELCETHYEEFILAVDELRGVLVDAEKLKSNLSIDNFKLQEVGCALLEKLEELLESFSVKKHVTEATKMSKICIEVLELCVKFSTYLSEGRFFLALKIIDLITCRISL